MAALNGIATVPTLAWVERNGADPKAVKFIEIPLPQEPASVDKGTIDGAILYEPWMTYGVDQGERIVYMDKNAIGSEFMLSGWITSKDWAEKNPPVAAAFASAIAETARWANTNHAASAPILAKYTKLPLAVVEKMHRATFGISLDAAMVKPVIDAAAEFKVLPQAFPAEDIFYRSK